MSEELAAARTAVQRTLADQGKSREYIEDFLKHYDLNLKNIDDWHAAKVLLDAWTAMREGERADEETVSLRANGNGKPSFHLSPEAFAWLLDLTNLPQ